MPTECSPGLCGFGGVEGWRVVAAFDGGAVTLDAGAPLLAATAKAIGVIQRPAGCFRDGRRAEMVEHRLPTLIGQRVFAIALGCEDRVDHDELRFDPVLATVPGKLEARRADCARLAGKPALIPRWRCRRMVKRFRPPEEAGSTITTGHDQPPLV